jgi:hypothetical protein
MSKLLLVIGALVAGLLILPATFWLGDLLLPLLPCPAAPPPWQWSVEKAALAFCINQHLPDYDVEVVREDGFRTPISIRARDNKALVYHFKNGHRHTVFARHENNLFIADFSPGTSGCEVVAIDLATGKQRWKSRLRGIRPKGHSEYCNEVNIETDGENVTVYGNESHGKYVEQLDAKSGRMLVTVKFDR